MTCHHRIPALGAAALATMALGLSVLTSTSCDFIQVNAQPGSLLLSVNEEELMAVTTTIGVFCENEYYPREDQMWNLSWIFLVASLTVGGLGFILAWGVSTFLSPTEFNWRFLSFIGAITATIQVPVFLVLDSFPCAEFRETQQCEMSTGSYFLIASTALWISVTFCTQCLDPPLAALGLSAWRVPKPGDEHLRNRVSDEEQQGTFYITRIDEPVPDAVFELKEPKRERPRWFSGRSRQSDMGLAAASTESMKDDEFDPKSPILEDRTWDDRVVLRSDYDGKLADQHERNLGLSEDLDVFVQQAEEGWLNDTATQSMLHPQARNNEKITYYYSSTPSKATERVTVISTSEAKPSTQTPELVAPSEVNNVSALTEHPLTSSEILADLETEGASTLPSSSVYDEAQGSLLNQSCVKAPLDRYTHGIRAITKKLKNDSKRRKSRWQSRRAGYQQMMDDNDDSDDEPFMSPPIEVEIKPFANFDDVNFSHLDLSDDEKEHLVDDWNALHRATTAGVRMGLQEGYSDDGENIDFFALPRFTGGDGYHSDPEPAYCTSEASNSRASASEKRGMPTYAMKDDDNSTLSSGTKSYDSGSKKRRHKSRQYRVPSSPTRSIMSGRESLLAVTIDEETVQDILEESSAGEDLGRSYSLQRTKSAPIRGAYGAGGGSRKNVRRTLGAMSVGQLQHRRDEEEKKEDNFWHRSEVQSQSEVQHTTDKSMEHMSTTQSQHDTLSSEEAFTSENSQSTVKPPPPYMMSLSNDARSVPGRLRKSRALSTRSLSPTQRRRIKTEVWRSDAVSLGGMHGRNRVADDDSSNDRSNSSHSTLSKRARQFRIKRMQRMKEGKSVSPVGGSERKARPSPQRRITPDHERDERSDAGDSYVADRQKVYTSMSQRKDRGFFNGNDIEEGKVLKEQEAIHDGSRNIPFEVQDDVATTEGKGYLSDRKHGCEDSSLNVPSMTPEINKAEFDDDYMSDRQGAYQESSTRKQNGSMSEETTGVDDEVAALRNDLKGGNDMPALNLDNDTKEAFKDGRSLAPYGGVQDQRSGHKKTTSPIGEFSAHSNAENSQFSMATPNSRDLPYDANAILSSFTEMGTPGRYSAHDSDDDLDSKYGNSAMDELDLQLIEVRRPIGLEYGHDEVSL